MCIKNLFAIAASILLCSCGSKDVGEDPRFFAPDKFKVVNSTPDTTRILKLEKLPIEVFGPEEICVKDSLLIVKTMARDKKLTIVNLRTNQVIARLAPEGRGPNDFFGCTPNQNFFYNDKGDLIMEVNDVEYLKAINISRSLREEGTFLEYSRKFKDIYENIDNNRHGFKTLFAYGDESYFVKHEISYRDVREGKYFPPKYIIKTPNGQINVEAYPESIESEQVSGLSQAMGIYASTVRIKPDHTKAVDITSGPDYINIIDLKTGEVTAVAEEGGCRYADYARRGDLPKFKRNIFSFGVSDKYIVALGNGADYYQTPEGRRRWPSIKVFDWKGNLVASAMFPKGLYLDKMAFDSDNNMAYFFVRQTEEFYRCNLSELLK